METLVIDPRVSERLIRERHALGADHFDEVWEGVYVVAPAPNDEHQDLAGGFTEVLRTVIDRRNLGETRPGINLASDPDDWEHNYRVPDVAVLLKDSSAVCHDTFWSGPPDFLVEIISPYDKSRTKLDFYSKIGTKELLLIDREPWQLELYRMRGDKLVLTAVTTPGDANVIESDVLPLRFRLLRHDDRPTIEVLSVDTKMSWTI